MGGRGQVSPDLEDYVDGLKHVEISVRKRLVDLCAKHLWRHGMSGRDALASHATPLEGWVSKGQTPDAKRVSVLTGALQNTAAHDPPFFDSSKTAQLFREGTEMGLLGLHSSGGARTHTHTHTGAAQIRNFAFTRTHCDLSATHAHTG